MFRIGKYIVTLLFFVTPSLKAQEVLTLSSPDGKIQGEFTLQDGKLSWKVDYNSIPVILPSRHGSSEIKTWTHVKVERKEVKSHQAFSFDLKASGGVALRLVKK